LPPVGWGCSPPPPNVLPLDPKLENMPVAWAVSAPDGFELKPFVGFVGGGLDVFGGLVTAVP